MEFVPGKSGPRPFGLSDFRKPADNDLIVWRGLNPTTGAFNVYLADLLKRDRPLITINAAGPVANEWPFFAKQTSHTARSQQ